MQRYKRVNILSPLPLPLPFVFAFALCLCLRFYKVGKTSGNSCFAIPPPATHCVRRGGGITMQELPEVLPTLYADANANSHNNNPACRSLIMTGDLKEEQTVSLSIMAEDDKNQTNRCGYPTGCCFCKTKEGLTMTMTEISV